jgi:hypothetical protein
MRCNASVTTRVLRGSSEAIGSSARMISAPWTSARDRDALLLSTREIIGALRGEARDVELLERGQRERLILVRPELKHGAKSHCVIEASHQHVGRDIEPADQLELLENHGAARAPLRQRGARETGDVDLAELDAPRGRRLQPVIMRSSVDLTAPEWPITPMKPPVPISRDTSSMAALALWRNVRPSMRSMAGGGSRQVRDVTWRGG